MRPFHKPGLLLAAIVTVGGLLTGSQALGQFPEIAAARQKVGSGFSDSSNQMAELRQRLHRRWRDDVDEARRRRRKVDLNSTPKQKRRKQIQAPVTLTPGEYVYFPSGHEDDSRFLVLAGFDGTSTLNSSINIKLAVRGTETELDLAVFDGDVGDGWDQGSGLVTYTLYEDPLANGTGTTQVAQWQSGDMDDDAWSYLNSGGVVDLVGASKIAMASHASARAPSGHYFFRLTAVLSNDTRGTLNCFKIRTAGSVRLEPQNSFNLMASLSTNADVNVVYPSYPSLSGSPYDGSWDIYAYAPSSIAPDKNVKSFDVWDGDLDFGHWNGTTTRDTNDPNTPAYPAWAISGSPTTQGAATGYLTSSGNPPDDFSRDLFLRSPSVTYDITDPSGVRYANTNPSGNREWELFSISTISNSASVADHVPPSYGSTPQMPAGVYQLHMTGMDLTNLYSLRFEYDILGVDDEDRPVEPLLPYILGDRVWLDTNGNGLQDDGATGIDDVLVTLLDDSGNFLKSTTTATVGGAPGYYEFNVAAGEYRVRVEASNFLPGGALDGYQCTTSSVTPATDPTSGKTVIESGSGGLTQTRTVATANIVTYDFGFRSPAAGSIGDTVWLDMDSDGMQDTDEPGIGGVTVTLTGDTAGGVPLTTTTDSRGFYLFSGLDGGATRNYVVTVTSATGPLVGLTQTYDSDTPGLSAHSSAVTLNSGQSNLNQDFGYRGDCEIGDLIWNDVSANGVYNAGVDAGIGNVRVILQWDHDGNGTIDMQASTRTTTAGAYLFTRLPPATSPGKYTVRVDTNTLPLGLNLIADPDGTSTPSYSTLTLALGVSNLVQDFGYQGAGSIGDLVWINPNSDKVQDSGELGISGVTVNLQGDLDHDGVTDYTATTTTDASGKYLFSNLPAGAFRVTVDQTTLPSGYTWTASYDLDGTGTAHTAKAVLLPRSSNLAYDFGYLRTLVTTANVGDFVWRDINRDGFQSGTEPGLQGVTVKLYQVGNATPLQTATTDSAGGYLFSNVAASATQYYVEFTKPGAAYSFSPSLQGTDAGADSDADTTTGRTAPFTVTAGVDNLTLDCGMYASATLGDYVWHDTTPNGIQESGEPGVNNITVELYNSADVLLATTTTGTDGAYSFGNLSTGTYYVRFALPSDLVFTTKDAAAAGDALDSDADPTTGKTAAVALTGGTSDLTLDAGLKTAAVCSVGDYVWDDKNGDGIQDSGEFGLSGVTVRLYKNGSPTATTFQVTGSSGAYLFTGLDAASYQVEFVLPSSAYTFSPTGAGTTATDSDAGVGGTGRSATFSLDNDLGTASIPANRTDIDAGAYQPCSIGDFVWTDTNRNGIQDSGEAGLNGVTVRLYKGGVLQTSATTATTGGVAGKYSFTSLTPGSYQVEFVAPSASHRFSPQFQGASIAADSDADTTTGRSATHVLSSGDAPTTVDAGIYALASVGDKVWVDFGGTGAPATNLNGIQDAGEPGVDNVTVELWQAGGVSALQTTTTSGGGVYSFTNLNPGSYYVKFVLSGAVATYRFSAQDQGSNDAVDSDANPLTGVTSTFSLSSGSTVTTWDAGIYNPATGSVGDKVWLDFSGTTATNRNGVQDAGEPGVDNVTVELWQAGGMSAYRTTTTSGGGIYSFTNLDPGSYYVKFVLSGAVATYKFSSKDQGSNDAVDSDADVATGATATFTLGNGQAITTIDAGISTPVTTASLGDKIWYDVDGDGVQDAGEPGIADAKAALYTAAGTFVAEKTTLSDGLYSFTGLSAGSYYVQFTLPQTYLAFSFTQQDQGTDDTADSDPGTTGRTADVNLGNGQAITTIDAGATVISSLGRYVWYDFNRDGTFQRGGTTPESGLANVKVTLVKPDGTTSITYTNSSGFYEFINLAAGTYTVVVDASTIPTAVIPANTRFRTYDFDGYAGSPDVATYQLSAGEATSALNFGYSIAPYQNPGLRYRTQTQGGWGSEPKGENVGSFLNFYWNSIKNTSPGGTIGCVWIGILDPRDTTGNTNRFVRVELTSQQAVWDLLPTGGTVGQLLAPTTGSTTTVITNPLTLDSRVTRAGVLLGQCVAVELGTRFSAAGITKGGLGILKLNKPGNLYHGQTVSFILQEGHKALGGRASSYWTQTQLSQLNDALSTINENFVDGIIDEGHLVP